jgi:hypothetical protein
MTLLEALGPAFWRWVADRLQPYWPPPRPSPCSATLLREDHDMLVYGITAPPVTAPDVVSFKFSMTVNGTAAPDIDYKVGDPDAEIKVQDNDHVSLTCVQVDDSGNVSPVSPAFEFDATDTIAPGVPGAPGVTLLREEP